MKNFLTSGSVFRLGNEKETVYIGQSIIFIEDLNAWRFQPSIIDGNKVVIFIDYAITEHDVFYASDSYTFPVQSHHCIVLLETELAMCLVEDLHLINE